ncbi:MAG TPA: DUF1254 domain-containing protein [Bdellovibrio sp.]|uniref:DUF1254 domain-containing protein n=1 Tax=Bdellovibrio sp. TaxID=28201 RepID=UPI002EFD3459
MYSRIFFVFALSALLFAINSCKSSPTKTETTSSATSVTAPTAEAGVREARILAEQVYAFGYPLVIMDVTKDMMTHSAMATESAAPLNQFVHKKTSPDDSTTDVASPNADTLYSSAWLDLSNGPVVLSLPDLGNRYYLMQMMSAWTDVFANPGSRTTGNGKIDFVVTGPNWHGTVPVGLQQIKAPTNDVWIIGRTQTNGPRDYDKVHALQQKYTLIPLSSWGQTYVPPSDVRVKEGVNMTQTPVDQVEALSGLDFFTRMAESMKRNPPTDQDGLMLEKMKRIGLVPGRSFDAAKLSPDLRAALNEGAIAALNKIINAAKNPKSEKSGGWAYNFDRGRYGTNYSNRATVAKTELGASLPQDTTYARAAYDSRARRLNGKNNYVIHFAKGKLPPVEAFWSVTMYNDKFAFVKNPLNKYAVGSNGPLVFNKDGSLTLFVQYQPPAKRYLANWLPTPQGNFALTARFYWPKKEILNRSWRMPGVQQIEQPLPQKQLSQNETFP